MTLQTSTSANIGRKPEPDAQEMRKMLQAMQSGELSVSRGIELLDMWLAGNYTNDQLPPITEILPEDQMPWDVINELRAEKLRAPESDGPTERPRL